MWGWESDYFYLFDNKIFLEIDLEIYLKKILNKFS